MSEIPKAGLFASDKDEMLAIEAAQSMMGFAKREGAGLVGSREMVIGETRVRLESDKDGNMKTSIVNLANGLEYSGETTNQHKLDVDA